MIEASKAAKLSSQPTKHRRKAWLIGVAVVGAVVTILLLANAPKPEPVKVWFVGTTNTPSPDIVLFPGQVHVPVPSIDSRGYKHLIFRATNGSSSKIRLIVYLFAGEIGQTNAQAAARTPHAVTSSALAAGKSCDFALVSPGRGVPYYIEWNFYDVTAPSTRWRKLRWECYNFFCAHNMPRLANLILPPALSHFIPSTEIKE